MDDSASLQLDYWFLTQHALFGQYLNFQSNDLVQLRIESSFFSRMAGGRFRGPIGRCFVYHPNKGPWRVRISAMVLGVPWQYLKDVICPTCIHIFTWVNMYQRFPPLFIDLSKALCESQSGDIQQPALSNRTLGDASDATKKGWEQVFGWCNWNPNHP